jgi:hypothetical protein
MGVDRPPKTSISSLRARREDVDLAGEGLTPFVSLVSDPSADVTLKLGREALLPEEAAAAASRFLFCPSDGLAGQT